MRTQKGFTLIQLLVVIVILGILAAVTIPNIPKFFPPKVEYENYTYTKPFYYNTYGEFRSGVNQVLDSYKVKEMSIVIESDGLCGVNIIYYPEKVTDD